MMSRKAVVDAISETIFVSPSDAEKIIQKAIAGGECSKANLESWLHNRFLPNCVLIDEEGYSRMCINALKILYKTAGTDYGSSRQRDFGQKWADMTRGYLGEYAFKLFLSQTQNIDAKLDHGVGEMADFLPTDIHLIKEKGEAEYRLPNLSISIKASKWNGIWLDIPGDQFSHSDIFVFVKVGTGQDHLFAFFKHISVFKDKILKVGREVGSLTSEESDMLFDSLPSFTPIPAYICGFTRKDIDYPELSYSGKMGRLHYTVKGWNGPINPGDLEKIKQKENVPGKVKFEGIGQFSHDKGYLFNTGNLLWMQSDWKEVLSHI